MQKHKVKFDYEPYQLEYFSRVQGGECVECGSRVVHKIRWYTPDFYLPTQKLIVEAKGKFTSQNRTKMLDVIRTWPELDIRMWFMYDNKLDKLSTVRYSDWCQKHNVVYHVGLKELPKWMNK